MKAEPALRNTRYLPVFEVKRPERMLAVIMPPTIGNIKKPAMVGVAPYATCKINGKVTMPPNMPIPTMKPMTWVRANGILRKRESGMRADSPAARSAKRKSTNPTAPSANSPTESVEPQPHSRPCSATTSTGTKNTTTVIAPHQSIFCGRGK